MDSRGEMKALDAQIERLRRAENLTETEIYELCQKAKEILSGESNVQPVRRHPRAVLPPVGALPDRRRTN
ncbi:hypothetical protein PHYSODRAFT_288448 [Phytophthora sojae]|uniref:Uncharacterized protein n=1 Tax=Phytophthora sojae (strain P6497) TaxID=1094619 RepID=G5A4K3_PHYSP|nr:hypothetical protein PHYSODRAFT_288448 [Phytophthora sojae]EGZ09604.1 hypothetical protein PHYSODRAFT_288448 [Phytophthora sojae]|eukprot:XP_009534465.1 hypothetical protein PHYSODRAFT_288448 [Phytophthora sojae]